VKLERKQRCRAAAKERVLRHGGPGVREKKHGMPQCSRYNTAPPHFKAVTVQLPQREKKDSEAVWQEFKGLNAGAGGSARSSITNEDISSHQINAKCRAQCGLVSGSGEGNNGENQRGTRKRFARKHPATNC